VLEHVSRQYGESKVLSGVSIERTTPGVIGIVGPNGAGKTTLLRVIAQLLEPDDGNVRVCDRVIERADDPVARSLVGWAPHEVLAWRDESVRRNLSVAGELAGLRRRAAQTRAAELIEAWQLEPVAEQAVRRCSRGWQQRYALARADILTPPILLLDEPTTGLDDHARAQLESAIDSWRPTRIVLIASHEREWLDERADALITLGDSA
jgi:oleandomycin transport system ATP-binding protein